MLRVQTSKSRSRFGLVGLSWADVALPWTAWPSSRRGHPDLRCVASASHLFHSGGCPGPLSRSSAVVCAVARLCIHLYEHLHCPRCRPAPVQAQHRMPPNAHAEMHARLTGSGGSLCPTPCALGKRCRSPIAHSSYCNLVLGDPDKRQRGANAAAVPNGLPVRRHRSIGRAHDQPLPILPVGGLPARRSNAHTMWCTGDIVRVANAGVLSAHRMCPSGLGSRRLGGWCWKGREAGGVRVATSSQAVHEYAFARARKSPGLGSSAARKGEIQNKTPASSSRRWTPRAGNRGTRTRTATPAGMTEPSMARSKQTHADSLSIHEAAPKAAGTGGRWRSHLQHAPAYSHQAEGGLRRSRLEVQPASGLPRWRSQPPTAAGPACCTS